MLERRTSPHQSRRPRRTGRPRRGRWRRRRSISANCRAGCRSATASSRMSTARKAKVSACACSSVHDRPASPRPTSRPTRLSILVERALAMAAEAPEDQYAGLAPAELARANRRSPISTLGPGRARSRRAEGSRAGGGECRPGGGRASPIRAGRALRPRDRPSRWRSRAGFSGGYRATGHSCSASVIAGAGSGMQRDYAWHSARFVADLEEAAAIGQRAGRAGRRAAQSGQGRRGQDAGPVRPARRHHPARPFHQRDQRQRGGAQVELPAGQARASGLRARRHDPRRPDPPARTSQPRVRRRGPCPCGQWRWSRMACSRPGSPKAPPRASSASPRPAMPCAGSADRRARGRPTCTWLPARRARDDLTSRFPRCILVTELIGQGVNGVTGDYSRGAAGFLIERRRNRSARWRKSPSRRT